MKNKIVNKIDAVMKLLLICFFTLNTVIHLAAQNSVPPTGNVGFGVANPQEPLSIASSNAFTLSLLRNAGSGNIGTIGTTAGAIYFGSYDPTATARYIGALIRARTTESWAAGTAHGTALTFETVANTTAVLTERMRIDEDGNVGIGTATPLALLDVGKPVNNQLSSVLGRLPESNGTGSGTYLGIRSINTQPINSNSFSLEHRFAGQLNNAINFYRGGAYQGGFITFGTNDGTEKMRIDAAGNVGIGTTTPAEVLHVIGNIGAHNSETATANGVTINAGNTATAASINVNRLRFGGSDANSTYFTIQGPSNADVLTINNGNIGIGTTAPATKLEVAGTVKGYLMSIVESGASNIGFLGRGIVATSGWSSTPDILALTYFKRDFAIGGWKKSDGLWGGASLYINSDNGNVGIGTTDPKGYKLAVNGTGIFTKVMVKPYANWADYVFDKDYKLPSLYEVENFIQQNKHLPDVPSAKDVAANGVDLGDNQVVLLKKVEELTLYIIELNKRIEQLEKQNDPASKK